MTRLDQTLEDLEFCIETLGMDDDQIEERSWTSQED